jgi:predicted Zn finger-like uncharacterized protein
MSDQLTQCPHCQTSFRVTPGQIKAASGLVRCGSCLGLFSAAINFIRVKPDPDDDQDTSLAHDDFGSSDDILLGDLDLDSLPLMEEADDDSFENAEEILLSDPVLTRRVRSEDYELYEEYEEAPDLLANLATVPVADDDKTDTADSVPFVLTSNGEPVTVAAPAEAVEDDADMDWLDGPSEEFRPRTILFDDDEGEDDDDDDDDDDAEEFAEERADDDVADETQFADFHQDDVTQSGREASLERGGPVLGELDADEFDTPELSELELEELLLPSDQAEEQHLRDADDDEIDASPPYEEYRAEAVLQEYMEEIPVEARDFGGATEDLAALVGQARQRPTASEGKPDWLQRRDTLSPEKAALHDYLSTLEDEDELEPLGTAYLDELDDEPVLLAADRRKRGLLATTGLLLLSLLLIGTLLLQFVDQHLDALRQRNSFARFEPWFCAVLNCPPPPVPVTASSSLYSQELLIRSHPRLRGALELSFIFRNDADEPQPFPGLELSFQNPANQLLANRLLLPDDYLPPELRPLATMPAHSSVQIMLELVDPGAEAVNYTIAFRDL